MVNIVAEIMVCVLLVLLGIFSIMIMFYFIACFINEFTKEIKKR